MPARPAPSAVPGSLECEVFVLPAAQYRRNEAQAMPNIAEEHGPQQALTEARACGSGAVVTICVDEMRQGRRQTGAERGR